MGAFREAKPFSATRALISTVTPPVFQPVSATTRRPVRATESRMSFSSSGRRVPRIDDFGVNAFGAQFLGRLVSLQDQVGDGHHRDLLPGPPDDPPPQGEPVEAFRNPALLLKIVPVVDDQHRVRVRNRSQQ